MSFFLEVKVLRIKKKWDKNQIRQTPKLANMEVDEPEVSTPSKKEPKTKFLGEGGRTKSGHSVRVKGKFAEGAQHFRKIHPETRKEGGIFA
jgi:hypothetical protein